MVLITKTNNAMSTIKQRMAKKMVMLAQGHASHSPNEGHRKDPPQAPTPNISSHLHLTSHLQKWRTLLALARP